MSFGFGRALLQACLLGLLFVGHATTAQAQYVIDNASETVPGTHSSPWTVPDTGELTVGDTGTGTLTINAGGIVTSTTGYIGNSSGSTGTVSVTGAGSTWNSGGLYVGYEGTGTLNVEDGAAYESNNGLSVGYSANAVGTVTVSGAGSLLDVGSGAIVGLNGNGTLNVENGATFNAQSLVISEDGGVGIVTVSGGSTAATGSVYLGEYHGFGTMNVSGSGTTWTINGGLEEGYDGDGGGAVNVTDGAHVSTTGELTVGYNGSDYVNTVTVSGANSLLSIGGSAYLAYDSAGSVLVSDGAHFDVTGYSYLSSDTDAPVTVTVTGQGSQWTSGYMYLGYYGSATVNVLDGGHVSTAGVTLGYYYPGTNGTLNVSGAGSQFVSNGDAYIGYAAPGSVTVSNGGLFQVVGNGQVLANSYLGDGSAGSVVVEDAGSLWKADDIWVGMYYGPGYLGGRGDVSVLNGGAIQANWLDVGYYYNTPGTLLVDGSKTSIALASGLIVGDYGHGIATLANGANVTAPVTWIAIQAGSTGQLIFGAAPGNNPVTSGSLSTPLINFGIGSGEIDFNLLGSYAFTPEVTGTGNINILAGTTTFSTDSNSYSGNIDVTGGKAVFNAALPGDVVVSNSGVVGGNGTIKSLTAGAGGTVAPGNSIGTLNVSNSVAFNAGSTYAVQLNAAGQSDLIYTPGTATLSGGTVKASGSYAITTYTILTAMNGVTGAFDGLQGSSPFLDLALSYDADNVYLNVSRGASLEVAADTQNQRSIARALDALPGDNPLSSAVSSQENFASARQAFDATSGEIHASIGTALADDTRYIREAINGRMIQASYGGDGQPIVLASAAPTDVATINSDSRMSLGYGSDPSPRSARDLTYWSRAFGAWGQYDGNGNAATTDRSAGGFISGIDAAMGGGWRAGVTGGYMYTGLDADALASSANVDSYVIGAYAGGPVGGLTLRAGGTWMWNDIDTSRAVAFPGFFESEKASYDGNTGQLFGEISLPLARSGQVVEPFAGLAYIHVDTDGFTESGSDAGLTSRGNSSDIGVGTVGARIGTTVTWGQTVIVPHASVAWQYAFGDTTPFQAMAFSGTNVGFDVGGVPLAENSALLDVGADVSIGVGATLGLAYIGQYAGHEQDNGIRGRLNWKF